MYNHLLTLYTKGETQMKKKYIFVVAVIAIIILGALALWNTLKPERKNQKENSMKEIQPVLIYKDSTHIFERIYLDPNDANVLYLFYPNTSGKSYKGEIYKSTDGGKNFKKLNVNGSLVAVSPKHPEVIFVGGVSGLFKSDNYGNSWAKTAFNSIKDIKFSAGGILYVLTDKGLFVSYDEGEHFNNVGLNKDMYQWHIFLKNGKDNVIYASVQLTNAKPEMKMGDVFLKSVDYGKTWKEIDKGLNYHLVTAFANNPDNDNALFAGTSVTSGGQGAPITSKTETGIFKSIDGGLSWKKVFPLNLVNAIVVDLDNTNTIYAGASNGLFRSIDSGKTWSKVELGDSPKTVVSDVKQSSISHTIYILQNGELYAIYEDK